MKSRTTLKSEAKNILSTSTQSKTIYILTIVMLGISFISTRFQDLELLFQALSILIGIIFTNLIVNTIKDQKVELLNSNMLLRGCKTILWVALYLIFYILGIIIFGAISTTLFLFQTPNLTMIGFFFAAITFIFTIMYIYKSYDYILAYYIVFDQEQLTAKESVLESKKLIKGHKMDYFIMQLSFILWGLLGICTLGIAYVYIIPYQSLTLGSYYFELKKEKQNQQ